MKPKIIVNTFGVGGFKVLFDWHNKNEKLTIKIGAIKAVRTLKPELGLGEAKAFVECCSKSFETKTPAERRGFLVPSLLLAIVSLFR